MINYNYENTQNNKIFFVYFYAFSGLKNKLAGQSKIYESKKNHTKI